MPLQILSFSCCVRCGVTKIVGPNTTTSCRTKSLQFSGYQWGPLMDDGGLGPHIP